MKATDLTITDWGDIGLAIAAEIPIVGGQATNEECIARGEALIEALRSRGVPVESLTHPKRETGAGSPSRTWFTVRMESGGIFGRWADTIEEAATAIPMWRGERCTLVARDPNLELNKALKSGSEVPLW